MMARFVFRLAAVLRHRKWIEDEKQAGLATAARALREAQAARQALCERREGLARELVAQHAALDGETLRISYAHMNFLAREINAADLQVVANTQLVELARNALVEASKGRKILERLRERQEQVHKAEELRFEQRDLDDANARRQARTQREGASS
jgi:flagellar protein FliJ